MPLVFGAIVPHGFPIIPDLSEDAEGGLWSRPPAFESARGGLASTADDLLAFSAMMLNQGQYNGQRILARPTVEAMTTPQVTSDQTTGADLFLGGNRSWGLGMSVVTRRDGISTVPGQYGWTGGYGTSWTADPAEQMTSILLAQRLWDSAGGPAVYHDFETLAYASIAA